MTDIIPVILGLLGVMAATIVFMIFFITFEDLGMYIRNLFFPGLFFHY